MSIHHHLRFALAGFLACLLALAALMVAVPAGAESDQPDFLANEHGPITVHVENTVCGDFSPTELVFVGTRHGRYSEWLLEEPLIGVEAEGWTDIKASAAAEGHEYRIHQRYLFEPRQFFELIRGFAVTVITRDDGATMQGDSMLFFNVFPGREQIDWLETPTCTPPRH